MTNDDLIKDENMELNFENEVIRGFRAKDKEKAKEKRDAWITVKDGEKIYYIGIWKQLRVISKEKESNEKEEIIAAIVNNKTNKGVKQEFPSKEEFKEALIEIIDHYGKPLKESDYTDLDTQEEVHEKIKSSCNIRRDEDETQSKK